MIAKLCAALRSRHYFPISIGSTRSNVAANERPPRSAMPWASPASSNAGPVQRFAAGSPRLVLA